MDIFLLILGLFFVLLGIVGSFLPVLPGPLTGWLGLLALSYTDAVPTDWVFLGITLGIALVVYVIDYIVPIVGAKRFGGSRTGMIGTSLGLLVGIIFFPPFGIVIGPFLGAFVGELTHNSRDQKRALKAAFGSFLGFLTGTFMKFLVSVIYFGLFIYKAVAYSGELFNFS